MFPELPTIPYLESLGLMLGTQLVLTLYGAGLRRPFGSLRTVKTAPGWLREKPALVLIADLAFAAFVIAMWVTLLNRLDLLRFLLSFFVFAGLGSFLAHRISLARSALLAVFCVAVILYAILYPGRIPGG